ncbi:hypothetical protein SDC9_161041 [bioreactor metagenome]|uniref:Uncharacterized protein n=1 Tax=bioreactor metagenome TaxID=1076179 RepID=A0A645FHA5_9ZZZZ
MAGACQSLGAGPGRRDSQQAFGSGVAGGHWRVVATVRDHSTRSGTGVGWADARHCTAESAAKPDPQASADRSLADCASQRAGRGSPADHCLQRHDGSPGGEPAGTAAFHRRCRAPDENPADRAQDADRSCLA